MAWPSSIPTFTALATLTAARLNDLRDALNVIGTSWTPYTPVLTGSGSDPTMGTSVLSGRYRKTGNTGDCHISFVVGSGFSAGTGSYRFSLPSGWTPLLTNLSEAMGIATARDTSVPTTNMFVAYYFSSTLVTLISTGGTNLGAATFTWATGDVISIHLTNVELS